MADPVKFTFDRAFDGGAKNRHEEELNALRSAADMQAQNAFQEGVNEGRQQAMNEIEAATIQILGGVEQAVHNLFAQRQQSETEHKAAMVHLAYHIAGKFAGKLIEQHPMDAMERLIFQCLQDAHEEPRLLIRVHESFFEPVQQRIDGMKERAAFEGVILVIAEPDFGPQDIRVEWAGGGAEQLVSSVQQSVEQILESYLKNL